MFKLRLTLYLLFTFFTVNAQVITELGFFAPLINSEDAKYFSGHLFVAQQGLKVFSVNNTANPTQAGSGTYPGTGNSPHQMAIANGYGYLAEGGGGYFSIYNLTNTSAPFLLGSVAIPSSEFITGGDLLVHNNKAYMTGADSLYVISVGIATSPAVDTVIQVVSLPPFGTASSLAVHDNYLYVLHTSGISIYDISTALSLVSVIPPTHTYHKGLTIDSHKTGCSDQF